MKYRKGVFIVTYKKIDNKVTYLLLKRKLHWKGWEFPKGGIKNESIINAIKRELKEETGNLPTNIKNHNHKGQYKYKKIIKDRKATGQTFSLYSAEIPSNKQIKIDKHEHSTYSWKEYGKALKLLTWPNQRKSLRIVNKSLQ